MFFALYSILLFVFLISLEMHLCCDHLFSPYFKKYRKKKMQKYFRWLLLLYYYLIIIIILLLISTFNKNISRSKKKIFLKRKFLLIFNKNISRSKKKFFLERKFFVNGELYKEVGEEEENEYGELFIEHGGVFRWCSLFWWN